MKKITKFSRDSHASVQIRLLYIMHSLGHCDNETLAEIISRHLEMRICFEHEEDEATKPISCGVFKMEKKKIGKIN